MKNIIPKNDLVYVSKSQMIEIDDLAVNDFGIPIIVMMENAGRNLASLAEYMLDNEVEGKSIAILAGKGNNAGGALAAARHLINYGAKVKVVMTSEDSELNENASLQLNVLKKTQTDVIYYLDENKELDLKGSQLLIDGLIGFNLNGMPSSPIAELIEYVNKLEVPVLANDTPTGLDVDTGIPFIPCMNADATLTLVLPKNGFKEDQAKEFIGELYLGDLGLPNEIFKRLDLKVPRLFTEDTIVRIN